MGYENVPWIHQGWEVRFKAEEQISTEDFLLTLTEKVEKQEPYSLIRLGDGELTIMSQELCLTQDWLRNNVAWYNSYNYCGVKLPDLSMRDRLIQACKDADVVGVFPNDDFEDKCFSSINFKPSTTLYAFANVYFCFSKTFVELLRKYPPMLVGSKAEKFAVYLYKELGIAVQQIWTDINCPSDIEQTIEYMAKTPHTWSLVSSGVNADIIAPIMAKQYGKVCVDYGQGMDTLLDLENKYGDRYKLNKD